MKNKIYEIIKEMSGTDEITDEMSLEKDLGFDSLMLVMTLVNIEEETGFIIDIANVDKKKIKTVNWKDNIIYFANRDKTDLLARDKKKGLKEYVNMG